jgi:CubicO group peptidase (beta-lactamase class C family)
MDEGFKTLYQAGGRTELTTAQMFEAATKDPMSFTTGERWQYSNVGYFLLGMIIEKASGRRYRDFLAKRLFGPLAMASTSVLDQWTILKNRAAGYTLRDGEVINIRRVTQVELPSDYGIFSTVKDLANWDNALAAGKVVKPSSLEQIWTPVKLNGGSSHPYGFGWFFDESRGHRMITHTGATGTEYTRFPDDKLTVIVLTNLGVRTGFYRGGLTKGVAGRFIPDLLLSSIKEQPEINPELTKNLLNLLSQAASREEATMMTVGLRVRRADASVANLAKRLQELKLFTFLSCDEIKGRVLERFGTQVDRTCYYKMVTKSETRYYTFALTSDDKVADFWSSAE